LIKKLKLNHLETIALIIMNIIITNTIMSKIVKKGETAAKTSKVTKVPKEPKNVKPVDSGKDQELNQAKNETVQKEAVVEKPTNNDLKDPNNIVREMLDQYFKIEAREKDESVEDTYEFYKKKFGMLCEIETTIAERRSEFIQVTQDLYIKFKKEEVDDAAVDQRLPAVEGEARNNAGEPDIDHVLEKDTAATNSKKEKKVVAQVPVPAPAKQAKVVKEKVEENDSDLGDDEDEAQGDEINDESDQEEVVVKTKSAKKKEPEPENDPSDDDANTKNVKGGKKKETKPVEKKKTVTDEKKKPVAEENNEQPEEKKPAVKKVVAKTVKKTDPGTGAKGGGKGGK
jgi:hypothetical protein